MSNLYMGLHLPKERCDIPLFASFFPVLTAVEFREVDLSLSFPVPLLNQGSTNSCNGHAWCTAFSRAWVMSGQKLEDFSPFWLYGLVNGGRDQGSALEDGAEAVLKYGFARIADIPQGAMYASQFPRQAYEQAALRKGLNIWQMLSLDELRTAITLGFACIGGIPVDTSTIGNLDEEWVPPVPRRIVGYHAIEFHGLKYSTKHKEFLPQSQNSWGQWGRNGKFRLTRQHFDPRFRFFAIRAVADNPNDTSNDPPVVSS